LPGRHCVPEFYAVQIIEAETGAIVDDRIVDNNGSFEWASDNVEETCRVCHPFRLLAFLP
jgi:hypothetical protein